MSTAVADRPTASSPAPDGGSASQRPANPLKIVLGLVGVVVVVWAMANIFLAFAYYPDKFGSKAVIGVLAIIVGVGGAALFFYALNMFVEGLPGRASDRVIPYAFLLPGLGLLGLMLVYPAVQTINYSFANSDSTAYVGFDNFVSIFKNEDFQQSIFNNILWLIIVPTVVVAIGVVVAVLSDKLSETGEKVAKAFIFVPMAISFVGASAIWSIVYFYNNPGQVQIGLLNAIWTGLGGNPQTWLQASGFRLNSLLMMVILIWLQVGFAMILLSSAIKGVPEDTIEAARIDGATELQIFGQVVIPQIKGTIITVFITVVILVLKVFDIVYVLTNGRDKTNVIAVLFYNEAFANDQAGIAAAIVVILLLAVLPVLVYQVRHFRQEEMNR